MASDNHEKTMLMQVTYILIFFDFCGVDVDIDLPLVDSLRLLLILRSRRRRSNCDVRLFICFKRFGLNLLLLSPSMLAPPRLHVFIAEQPVAETAEAASSEKEDRSSKLVVTDLRIILLLIVGAGTSGL